MNGIPSITRYPIPPGADLPSNTAPWHPDPARAVLLIHDMQRYFLEPFDGATRKLLLTNVRHLRERASASGVPVGYTAQPGGMDDAARGLLKDFWGAGMRRSDQDRAIADEVAPTSDDWTFTKLRYSAFFGSDLLDRLRAAGRDQLILCGVYAHVGVLATAIDSFSNDVQTFLVADAVADFSAHHHRMALEYAAGRCAVVLRTKEVFG
jgi:isochorismate hydrolase